MTKEYIEKLIRLAKEIEEDGKPIIGNSVKEVHQLSKVRQFKFNEKLNHLLGYILALEHLKIEENI
jgi:hypothetical protein